MGREDYYRRKAKELMVAAHATRDSGAADWLRANGVRLRTAREEGDAESTRAVLARD
jgi:hypothetical protein